MGEFAFKVTGDTLKDINEKISTKKSEFYSGIAVELTADTVQIFENDYQDYPYHSTDKYLASVVSYYH